MQLSNELARQSKISRVRAAVKPEPQSGADISNVKFQLPSGKKIARNFVKTDCVEDLRNYLIVYFEENKIELLNFSISTNYPKRVLDDAQETLLSAGLYPRGMLFVQNLDA